MNQHLWPESAGGPPIPRKVAVRFQYGDGPEQLLETAAVPHETVCVHITPTHTEPPAAPSETNESNAFNPAERVSVTADAAAERLVGMQWSAGKPGGGGESYEANPWRFNSDHTFVTE